MTNQKLEYLNHLFAIEMQENRIKGAAIRVFSEGSIVFDQIYGTDERNTIYKIFSMSKPITAVAAMILYERGMVDLLDPVSKYLPAYKDMKVVGENGLEDCKQPIRIKDLMNMTSGLMYADTIGMSELCMMQISNEINERLQKGEKLSNVEICSLFAKAPLKFEPGKRWAYGTSADVMGAVIEVISGETYSTFLKKEIFDPLQMKDTDFYVDESKKSRIAKVYSRIDEEGHLDEAEQEKLLHLDMAEPCKSPVFESAGGGLYSTIEDYSHFAMMLLGKGNYRGTQILGRKTIDFLQMNQLTREQEKTIYFDSLFGYSYGNYMRVMVDKRAASSNGSIGEFGWDGLLGNYFLVDPEEELAVIYMQQITEGADQSLRRKMRQIIYGAI